MNGDEEPTGTDAGSRHLGWTAGIAGLSAVGILTGVSIARSMTRPISAEDLYAGEDFGTLKSDRSYLVTTPDGVPLAVREVGPSDAPLTVVFAHGFCMRKGAFHFQRVRLTEQWGSQVRMVFYDQRGHGESGEASTDTYTVPQLGVDLEAVLQAMAPSGPIVLVGHSMGGMTVLSHARQYPGRYGSRIVGAALIASAAEGVTRTPLGGFLKNPALDAVRVSVRYAPKLVQRSGTVAGSVIGPVLRACSYGDEEISPSVVAFSEEMMLNTPIATMVGFLHSLEVYDETAALPVLARIPSLVACGDHDLMIPDHNSRDMVTALPKSELLIVAGSGHLVQLEAPDVIDDALVRLVERATPNKLVALTRRVRERVRRRA